MASLHPIASVSLSSIDWSDRTFFLPGFTRPHPLEASLDRHGILCPPWVWCKAGSLESSYRHVIVDGFKRLRWAQERGCEGLECVVFPPETSLGDLMVRRIEARLFGPPLTIPEKAAALAMLTDVLSLELVVSRYLPSLHLAPRAEVLAQWLRLAGSGEGLLKACECETVCERAALELAAWEEEPRAKTLDLLALLRCSASIQMELLERIGEIATIRHGSRTELLEDGEVQAVLQNPQSNRRQKTQTLRELFTKWRLPRLWEREERHRSDLLRASLPPELRLTPPPSFEGDRWQFQVSFSSTEELGKSLQWLLGFCGSDELHRLLND